MQPLDLTAVLSSWPVWAAAIIVFALLFFRHELRALLARMHRVKVRGAEFEATDQRQAATAAVPPPDALLRPEDPAGPPPAQRTARDVADAIIHQIPRSEYLNVREKTIEEALRTAGVTGDDTQKARLLLTVAAASAMAWEFERLYNQIFGSQIRILQTLNAKPLPVAQLAPIYNEAAAQIPDFFATYPFEQYLTFLTGQGLVVRQEDGNLGITLKGRTFLVWLAHDAKPLNRPG